MRKNLLILLLLLVSSCMWGQHSPSVRGYVWDYFNEKPLVGAKVVLWQGDSLAIDSVVTDSKAPGEYNFIINKMGQYSVTASLKNYEGEKEHFSWTSWRIGGIMGPTIMMYRKSHELGEVVVKATKVKFVVRGDTLVYNADAFNLAEGSSLKTLIKKLPGVELKDGGRIFVNGRYVQSLLINGSSLFSDKPDILLDNLPAFTVHRVKVYNKRGLASIATGRNMNDSTFVMDVQLKKKYETGYLGSLAAGGGTDHRYKLNGFSMARSKVKSLMAFGNLNNLTDLSNGDNDDSRPDLDMGLTTVKKGGISYHSAFGQHSEYTGDVVLSHQNNTMETRTSRETFLSSGSTTGLSNNMDLSKSTDVESHHKLNLFINNGYLSEDLSFSYSNSHQNGHSDATTYSVDELTNQRSSAFRSHAPQISVNSYLNMGRALFAADMLFFNFHFSYDHMAEDRFTLDDVRYVTGGGRDYRNNYLSASSWQRVFNGTLIYRFQLWRYVINAGVGLSWNDENAGNYLYRLDRMKDRDSLYFDLLPSAADALARVRDEVNSYHYRKSERQQNYSIQFSGREPSLGNLEWMVTLPVTVTDHHINYQRQEKWKFNRKPAFFNPSLQVHRQKADSTGNVFWMLQTGMSSDLLPLEEMIDYRDDSDPLSIKMGNPDLKNTHRYQVEFQYNHSVTNKNFNLNLGFHQTDNAMAYALTFDQRTGVSTLRPVSVNGNWDTDLILGFSRPIDRAGKLSVDNELSGSYQHNVDMATTSTSMESMRSIVHNWQLKDELELDFRPNDNYEIAFHGGGTYSYIHGRREGFSDIHAGDYNIGLDATVDLPWHFHLSTDLTMFARRGYQQDEMNTTDWVWNAQLIRSFIHGKLLAKLKAFDILHELSTTSYAVNAQGRTETWHNSIPRYLMFSLSWKFNISPKKND